MLYANVHVVLVLVSVTCDDVCVICIWQEIHVSVSIFVWMTSVLHVKVCVYVSVSDMCVTCVRVLCMDGNVCVTIKPYPLSFVLILGAQLSCYDHQSLIVLPFFLFHHRDHFSIVPTCLLRMFISTSTHDDMHINT